MMTLNEFKELNKSKGFHWFSKGTMRYFKSRISNWDSVTGYFITSEHGPGNASETFFNGPRKFSIRKANFDNGNVDTIGQFQQYNTLGAAKTALRCLLRG